MLAAGSASLLGRPWTQAEVFGIAPDPTAIGTLGVLLLDGFGMRTQCALPGSAIGLADTARLVRRQRRDLWTMDAPEALLLPALAAVAAGVAIRTRRPDPAPDRAGRPVDAAARRAVGSQVRPPGVDDDVRTIRGSSACALSRAIRSAPPSATTPGADRDRLRLAEDPACCRLPCARRTS